MSIPIFSDSTINLLINELLYKKYNNLPLTNQGLAMVAEPSTNSRPQIIPDEQIWSQRIPLISPTKLIDIERKNEYDYTRDDYSIRQKSEDFNYIEYYTKLKLYTTNNFSYKYFDGTATNLLENTIFSKTKNYLIKIYKNDIEIGAEIKWSIDCDAGYLNFYESNFLSSDIITISFWKYTGLKGLLTPDNTNNVKKTEENIMESGSSVVFEKEEKFLNINDNGISSTLPININDNLNISGLNSSINVSSESSINFLNTLEGENIIKIDSEGITSNLPIFSKDILFLGKKWRIREDNFGNLLFEYNNDSNNPLSSWNVAVPFNIPFK